MVARRQRQAAAPVSAAQSRKRRRSGGATKQEAGKVSKRSKISHPSHSQDVGVVLVLGQGDVGQLGLGEDVMERAKPTLVRGVPHQVVQAVAGGMHTACLTTGGEVWTFGCNDEGALGRDTTEEGSEMTPAKVDGLEGKVIQLSAGDSHTAALTDDGRVLIWGSFRDSTGVIGLLKPYLIHKTPIDLLSEAASVEPALSSLLRDLTIVKIASGNDHLVMLTTAGEVFTVGNSEQGQLGRLAECFCSRGGRKGLAVLIQPSLVRFRRARGKQPRFTDVWAGAYVTFAKEESGKMYGWGLNNYYQLGLGDMENRFVPNQLRSFDGKVWSELSSGQHHTLALDSEGRVYVSGRAEYGRLGLGKEASEKTTPTVVGTLNGTRCSRVDCGSAISLATTKEGQVLSWGMGTNGQLGQNGDDDVFEPSRMLGKQLQERKVMQISGGGQHVVLLASDPAPSTSG